MRCAQLGCLLSPRWCVGVSPGRAGEALCNALGWVWSQNRRMLGDRGFLPDSGSCFQASPCQKWPSCSSTQLKYSSFALHPKGLKNRCYTSKVKLEAVLILQAYRCKSHKHSLIYIYLFPGPSQTKLERKCVCANKQTTKHIMQREDGGEKMQQNKF